jgi:transposase
MAWRRLSRAQWDIIRVHLPQAKASSRGGRPRVEDRRCFEGILWILWTGAQWSELPRRYGSPSTCWRCLKHWEETGVLLKLWRAFLAQLNDRQKLRWDECFADGSFIPAKKGDPKSAQRGAARVRSGWFWSMARVLRWEHTWTRRPRRKSRASKRPSTPLPLDGQDSRGDRASGPSGNQPLGGMAAIPCGSVWPAGALSRSSRLGPTASTRPIKTAARCVGIGVVELWSARVLGWVTFGISSSA